MIRKGSRNPKPLAPCKQRGASLESEQSPRRTGTGARKENEASREERQEVGASE